MRRLRSVRVRLTAWYTLALLVLLTLFALAIYLLARAQLYDSFDQSLRTRLQEVSAALDHDSSENHLAVTRLSRDESMVNVASGERVLLFDGAGRVLDQLGKPLTPAQQAALWRAVGSEVRMLWLDGSFDVRLARSAPLAGGLTVVVARPDDPVEQPLHNILIAFAVAAPLALLLAAIGGYFLTGRVLRPVAAITHAAREMRAHDLSHRLALGPAQDELTELASTFDAMLDRIEAGVERQRRFTADASHELRTPLTAITTHAELALSEPRTAADYRATLTTILGEGQQMQRLIADLLDLARSDAEQLAAQEPVDLLDLATEAIGRLSGRAAAAGVELWLDDGGVERAVVCGSPGPLGRVLLNLLDNAIKYSPAGGCIVVQLATPPAPPVAEVNSGEVQRNCPLLAVSVLDQGAGITADHLPHLFDRFYRADAARTREENSSSGLGLAICAAIAHAHGGWIGVSSQPQGSRFTLYLPVAAGNCS